MTSFIPSLKPFHDFIVVIDRNGHVLDQSARCLHFSGIAFVGGRCITTLDDFNVFLRTDRARLDLTSATGVFSVVISTGNELIIQNDLLGMEPLFYFQNGNYYIVSNRLHAIIHWMKLHDIQRTPDNPVILCSLSSTHTFFQQPYTHHTYVKGLMIVPASHYIIISDAVFTLVEKSPYRDLYSHHLIDEPSYRSLIKQGAQDIVSNIMNVMECGLFDNFEVDISGGRDSRTVMAAVLRSGCIDRCGFTTNKSNQDKDFEIGLHLTNLTGGRFFEGDQRKRYSKSARFCINVWRSIKASLYHRIGIPSWFSFRDNMRSIHFIGGCGEIYRDFWYTDHKTYFNGFDLNNDNDILRHIFTRFCNRGPNISFIDSAFESFSESIRRIPGEDIREKFSNHYLYFRNRFHFGTSNYNAYSQAVEWSPYQSLSLLKAAFGRSFDERAQKMVTFDIIDELSSILNFIEFDDGKWRDPLLQRSKDYNVLKGFNFNVNIGEILSEWNKSQERKISTLNKGARVVDPPIRNNEIQLLVGDESKKCLGILKEENEFIRSFINANFESFLDRELESNSLNSMQTASKIMSIHDLCVDNDTRCLVTDSLPFGEDYVSGFSNVAIFQIRAAET